MKWGMSNRKGVTGYKGGTYGGKWGKEGLQLGKGKEMNTEEGGGRSNRIPEEAKRHHIIYTKLQIILQRLRQEDCVSSQLMSV